MFDVVSIGKINKVWLVNFIILYKRIFEDDVI